ncbi:MAG: LysM peptidoglycan-binding domain-containing protein [Candidatus Acidiferrales bacterium]
MRKTIKQHSVVMVAVVVSAVLSTGSPNFAQSVADAARQERERKRELALHATHVYTNEDLSKPHILLPEDEARVAARQKEPTGAAEAAITAAAATPEPAAVVPDAPVAVPDIKELATAPALPSVMDIPTNIALPADVSKSAPQVASYYPQPSVSAPAVAGQTGSSPILALPASAPGAAGIMLPATVSKPLAKEANNRRQAQVPVSAGEISVPPPTILFTPPVTYGLANIVPPASIAKPLAKEANNRRQAQVPVSAGEISVPPPTILFTPAVTYGLANIVPPASIAKPLAKEANNRMRTQTPPPTAEIKISSTAMPFATAVAYVPANLAVPAPFTPPIARSLTKQTTIEAVAPRVDSPFAAAPVRLSLTEHTIVRPEADPVTEVRPVTCARPCESRVSVIPPAEVLIRTVGVRPDVAKTAPSPAVDLWGLNRNQAIVGSTGKVKVLPGDSLWRLAERYFGNGSRWKRLAALNPQLADPNRILVGAWIEVPLERRQSAKHVVVQPGDTLWKVARAELGSPLALNCLVQANPQLHSVDMVLAGETLVVPVSCGDLGKTQN